MMAQPFRSVRTGPSLFNIPGAPTVARTTAGTFGKLSDEVVAYYKRAAADALNSFAYTHIALPSLREVPRGPDPEHDLAESISYPGVDPGSEADENYLVAYVSYNTDYADAQEEGVAEMVHHHPIIHGREGFFEKLSIEREIVIQWKAEHYTTPGTKAHFLRDPYIAAVPYLEIYMYRRVREAFLG